MRSTQPRQVINGVNLEYSPDELEFLRAIDKYKHERRRRFPNCCEVLQVLKSLGYRKVAAEGPLPVPGPPLPALRERG